MPTMSPPSLEALSKQVSQLEKIVATNQGQVEDYIVEQEREKAVG